MKKRMFVLAAAAAMAFVSAAANAAVVSIKSGAGWTAGYNATSPFSAPNVLFNHPAHSGAGLNPNLPNLGSGFGVLGAALQYTTASPNSAWTPSTGLPGASWMGYKAGTNGLTNSNNSANANFVGYYLFQTSVGFLTNDLGTINLSGNFSSDNRVVGVFLNGTPLNIGSITTPGDPQVGTPEVTYNTISGQISAPVIDGAPGNPVVISFIVENNRPDNNGDGNPVGLLFSGTLTTSGSALVIPLPSAVWGGLALMGMVVGNRARRSA